MNPEPRIADFPATVPLLPLAPWILLPETELPINITAAAGRIVIEAALAAGGWVGVVQLQAEDSRSYFPVGCLARIHEDSRDEDSLYVRLEGVVRFRLGEVLPGEDGVPRGTVEYGDFAADLQGSGEEAVNPKLALFKERIVELGREQFGSAGVLEAMSPRQIVLFMAQTAPLTPAEKQALLEARDFQTLLDTLAQLLVLSYATTTPDTTPHSRVN